MRKTITKSIYEGEIALTIMKPFSEENHGRFICLYEDAYGEFSSSLLLFEDVLMCYSHFDINIEELKKELEWE